MIFRPKIDFLKLPPNVTPGMPPASPRTPRARKRLFRALGRLKGRPGEACIMSKNLYKKSKIQEKIKIFRPKIDFFELDPNVRRTSRSIFAAELREGIRLAVRRPAGAFSERPGCGDTSGITFGAGSTKSILGRKIRILHVQY